MQSDLSECQRLTRSNVVDYSPLTKLRVTFVATNTKWVHTTLTKEDQHAIFLSMCKEDDVQLLV